MTWPYETSPELELDRGAPTWICPGGICECHPRLGTGEEHELSVVLTAEDGARMPNARCRIFHQGRLLEGAPDQADRDGRVLLRLDRVPDQLFIEWAPENTPLEPRYPYRSRHFANLAKPRQEAGRRRLHNLGFWTAPTLAANVEAFQRRYGFPVTKHLEDIEYQLELFHDHGCPPITHDEPVAVTQVAFFGEGDQEVGQGRGAQGGGAQQPKGPPAPPTPQPPLPPAPNPTTTKPPSPAVAVDLEVDWGWLRARRGRAARRSTSFLLNPTKLPVKVGVIDAFGRWHVAPFSPELPVKRTGNTTALVSLPLGPVMIRVEIDLEVTVASETASALAFRQLYFLDAAGNLHPLRFGFQDYTYRRGPPAGTRAGSPPVRAPGKGAHVADGIRLGAGEHPLTALGPRRPAPAKDPNARPTHSLLINAEMLDITDLWWRLHPEEEEERLLHPGLGGRIEHFRILAWASGALPILWFAAVPDAALTSSDGADIVLFRPPAEANSFTHQPDAKAIAHEHHHKVTLTGKVTTMWMLARFLLAPKTVAQLRKAGVTDPRTIASFADEIQPVAPRSQGKIVPAVPTPFVSGFPVAFRACALERALQQTGVGHVLLLPFASENDGYPGAQQAGLKGIVESAYLCLWNQCAVSRHLPMSRIQPDLDEIRPTPQRPDPRKRKLWVVGHSFGNTMMAAALSSNALDVERAISISPTTATSFVVNNARSAAAARKKNGASLDLFMVTAPDHTKQYLTKTSGSLATSCRGVSMDVKGAQALIRTGARVTFLPAFDAQLAHYTLAPGSAIPPMLRTVLGQWTDDEIATSAKLPAGFNFLFMHEYPMYGGEPARSFFEVALGKPQPLLVEPTTLPP